MAYTKEFQEEQRQRRADQVAERMQQALEKRQVLEARMVRTREERDLAIRTRMGPGMEVGPLGSLLLARSAHVCALALVFAGDSSEARAGAASARAGAEEVVHAALLHSAPAATQDGNEGLCAGLAPGANADFERSSRRR